MQYIKLTKGLFTKVDDDDFEYLNRFTWYASGLAGKEYAARRMRDNEEFPQKLILMHQVILKTINTEKFPDHVDGDRLNNQRYNLIAGTQAQNLQNTSRVINQVGVGLDRTHGTFKAYINIGLPSGTKRINVGTYKSFDAAVLARAAKIKELGL